MHGPHKGNVIAGGSPQEYRAKGWEYLSLAESINDPERRAEMLRFAKMWMSLLNRWATFRARTNCRVSTKRWEWASKPETFTAARTATNGCSLVNSAQGAFSSGTSRTYRLAEKRPTLKSAHSSVSETTGRST